MEKPKRSKKSEGKLNSGNDAVGAKTEKLKESELKSNTGEGHSNKKRSVTAVTLFTVVVALLASFYLGFKYKSLFVVAKVGKGFIYRWELEKKLNDRYAQTTLDELVNLKLIRDGISSKGIKVSEAEVNQRITEIEKSLQGTTLEEALKQQGMTLQRLKEQVYLQVGLEKALADKIAVTDEEINAFIKDNGSSLTATDDEGKKKEVMKILKDQKLQQEASGWITGLKAKSKVVRYI